MALFYAKKYKEEIQIAKKIENLVNTKAKKQNFDVVFIFWYTYSRYYSIYIVQFCVND